MAVPMGLPAAGTALEHGTPARLFSVRGAALYTPAPDGQRFLVNQIVESGTTSPITIVLNWNGK